MISVYCSLVRRATMYRLIRKDKKITFGLIRKCLDTNDQMVLRNVSKKNWLMWNGVITHFSLFSG